MRSIRHALVSIAMILGVSVVSAPSANAAICHRGAWINSYQSAGTDAYYFWGSWSPVIYGNSLVLHGGDGGGGTGGGFGSWNEWAVTVWYGGTAVGIRNNTGSGNWAVGWA